MALEANSRGGGYLLFSTCIILSVSLPPPQFLDSKIKFPQTFKLVRPASRTLKTTFKATRPTTAMF